ncbi:peptidylprolyl isomerase [Paenibacillus segetis]|uniref:peptidylprolyl isomerase n=1 Tax=Paenibacillus segetis TaxID=1325360 RepID=A0ABQ1YPJ7_9BACL|nr:peptidylprolyl isomerase [Paenibacillus segetis]GGH33830.1 hypothetical protein GCM10008013_39220 [Paenibacillus segetis]
MEDKDKKDLEAQQGGDNTDNETVEHDQETVEQEAADHELVEQEVVEQEAVEEVVDQEGQALPEAELSADAPQDGVEGESQRTLDPSVFAIPTSSENQKPAVPGKAWAIASLVLAVLLVIVLIKPPFGNSKSKVVATVNGSKITQDDLYEKLVDANGAATLEDLITKELLDQEVAKAKITITDADIEKEFQGYIDNFGSMEALEQAMAQAGLTEDILRENIEINLKMTKLLEPQITVTDDEINQTFETYKDSFNTPEQVRASVILVKTEAEANDIIKELKGGADFAELAKTKSLDEATKANGGDTGFFAKEEQEEALSEAAFKLEKDEISGAVKTSEGYHVIKLTDRKEAHTATLEEKKEEIRKSLVGQQVSSMSGTWLQDIRSKAKITNTLTDAEDTNEEVSSEVPAE